jgi:hypothetical protein
LRLEKIFKYVGLIAVAGIALSLVVELALGLRGQYVFNPNFLILGLNLSILCVVSFVVAYLSAKGYLLTGSLTLLIIMNAFVVIGVFAIANGLFATFSLSNEAITTTTLGLTLFSVLQFLSSVQASFRSASIGSEHRKGRLAATTIVALSLSGIILVLTALNTFPAFFINGKGVTLVDQIFYPLVALFFLVASMLYLKEYRKSKSSVLYWYILALLLDTIGAFGIMLQVNFGDIVAWTGRLGIYFGTIYFLIALLSTREKSAEV